ncbi:MAG: hypothetical protein JST49_01500 [Bacteroidetes bacterium]|nr:hypothetical protein [Bacteroidota bacterium]
MITTVKAKEGIAWQWKSVLGNAIKTMRAIASSLSLADVYAIEKRKQSELHEAGLYRW